MMGNNIIEINHLSFRYRHSEELALKDVNLHVPYGQWVAVTGHNGSGKSTLARFLNALLIPDAEGAVIIGGLNTKTEGCRQEIRRKAAMVFQNPDNQMVAPTVEDDVAFGLENAGVPYEEMVIRVQESIDKLGLTGLEKREPHRLSGGQKQRAAIAGAVAMKPELLILDEATSMLDPSGRAEVIDQVQKLRDSENMTILTITHDLNEAALADRIVVMREGEIIGDGTPAQIFRQEDLLKEASLKKPFIIELIASLREKEVDIPEEVTTEEELVNHLCRLKQTM
ncbi:energy-coupling factor transporter ATPase [Evansella clarkii]|uniref:energy-coupling factor transporter ATPase n=1 Tax=Evansella clarkii TaxID=79879 RepID=UPI000B438919|nr:energy-coupling factor transporter ATPase [Evansella clarkii]